MDDDWQRGSAGRHRKEGSSQDRFRGAEFKGVDGSRYMVDPITAYGGDVRYQLRGYGPDSGRRVSERELKNRYKGV